LIGVLWRVRVERPFCESNLDGERLLFVQEIPNLRRAGLEVVVPPVSTNLNADDAVDDVARGLFYSSPCPAFFFGYTKASVENQGIIVGENPFLWSPSLV